jgi:hypothetical protein
MGILGVCLGGLGAILIAIGAAINNGPVTSAGGVLLAFGLVFFFLASRESS